MKETNNTWEQEILNGMQKLYPETEVEIRDVAKAGGVKRAILIRDKGLNISPTIYLEAFEDMDVEKACDEIQRVYEEHKPTENVNLDWFQDFEQVKDKLHIKLLNAENNKEYLSDKPFVQILDLAAAFYVNVNSSEIGEGIVTVLKSHAEVWNVTAEELYEVAIKNEKAVIKDIADVIEEMTGEKAPDGMRGHQFVVSNKSKCFGAGTILTELETLKERFGKFYVLPSSVHEVLVIPARVVDDKKVLDDMVKEVNATEVDASEVLSDHAYYFNGEELEA